MTTEYITTFVKVLLILSVIFSASFWLLKPLLKFEKDEINIDGKESSQLVMYFLLTILSAFLDIYLIAVIFRAIFKNEILKYVLEGEVITIPVLFIGLILRIALLFYKLGHQHKVKYHS